MYLSELIRLEPSLLLLLQFTAHELTILFKTCSCLPDIEEPDLLYR